MILSVIVCGEFTVTLSPETSSFKYAPLYGVIYAIESFLYSAISMSFEANDCDFSFE